MANDLRLLLGFLEVGLFRLCTVPVLKHKPLYLHHVILSSICKAVVRELKKMHSLKAESVWIAVNEGVSCNVNWSYIYLVEEFRHMVSRSSSVIGGFLQVSVRFTVNM